MVDLSRRRFPPCIQDQRRFDGQAWIAAFSGLEQQEGCRLVLVWVDQAKPFRFKPVSIENLQHPVGMFRQVDHAQTAPGLQNPGCSTDKVFQSTIRLELGQALGRGRWRSSLAQKTIWRIAQDKIAVVGLESRNVGEVPDIAVHRREPIRKAEVARVRSGRADHVRIDVQASDLKIVFRVVQQETKADHTAPGPEISNPFR